MGYLIITFSITLIVFVVIGIKTADWEGAFLASLLSFALSIIIILIPLMIIYTNYFETEEYIYEEQELFAMKDNIGLQGNFFLGSGHIDNNIKYYYMIKYTRGLKLNSIYAGNVYLVEDNNEKPRIVYYSIGFTNKFIEKWFPYINNRRTVTIYIPEGSIKYNYQIDLQ